jgi:hypothetical protein
VLCTASVRAFSLPLPVFLAGGVGGSALQIFAAPVTHQDQGTDRKRSSPLRVVRTRKSSVPCCVQETGTDLMVINHPFGGSQHGRQRVRLTGSMG